MLRRKNIRTEVATGDALISRSLNRRPIFGVEENGITDPKRNSLLAHFAEAGQVVSCTELANLGGKNLLAANDLDSSIQGGDVGANVVLLHGGSRKYTRKLVGVNKNSCFSDNKEPCTVLSMATTLKKKPLEQPPQKARRKRAPEPEVGPDGRTLAQRVAMLMQERGVSQAELARMCSQYYAAFVPLAEDKVKQQHIFNILQGQSSSWAVSLIASVFDVNDMWLQYGIGKRERGKSH